MIITLASISLLFGITYQDFRDRLVHIILYVGIIGVGIYRFYHTSSMPAVELAPSFLFLLTNLLVIFGYLFIKGHSPKAVLENHLGIGDVIFWFCLPIFFSFPYYIIFHLTTLIVTVVVAQVFNKSNATIPLAGSQALMLAVLLSIDSISTQFSTYHTIQFFTL